MITAFADRLSEVVRRRGNAVCLGLDPRWELLPRSFQERYDDGSLTGVASAFEAFCRRVLELVGDAIPVVKPQAAFFEWCGPDGMRALQNVLRVAQECGAITILDAKRGDIASTAVAYAEASFAGAVLAGQTHRVWNADALTINPYLGADAIEPFIQEARRSGRGLFVLVRTSNPGAGLFQDLRCDGEPVYVHVARAVAVCNQGHVAQCGFGDVGAVVGATHPEELATLRQSFPEVWFLVPGYGAQGAGIDAVRPAFRGDGLGAVVNSSRGLTFPFRPDDPDWEQRIRDAVAAMTAVLRV